jgi:hypothetical protein
LSVKTSLSINHLFDKLRSFFVHEAEAA